MRKADAKSKARGFHFGRRGIRTLFEKLGPTFAAEPVNSERSLQKPKQGYCKENMVLCHV